MAKKYISLFICFFIIIMPVTSLSHEYGSIVGDIVMDTAKQTISFSGVSVKEEYKTVYVLLQNEAGETVFADCFETDYRGRYDYSFLLKKSGNFTLTVRMSGEETQVYHIENYVALHESCLIVKKVLSAADTDEFITAIKELNIDGCEFIDKLSNEEKVSLNTAVLNSGYTSEDFDVDTDSQKAAESYKNFTFLISERLIAFGLKNSSSADEYSQIFNKYIKYFVFAETDIYYGSMTETEKEKVCAYMYSERAYADTLKDISESFGHAVFMTEFEKLSKKDDFEDLFKQYSLLFEDKLVSEYNSLNIEQKSTVNAYMINNRNQIKVFPDIKKCLKDAFDNNDNSTAGTKRPGSGGGGGKGSSASGYITAPKLDTDTDRQSNAAGFADVDVSHWALESINYLKTLGVINGRDDGNFYPESMITREEFAAMLCKAFNLEKINDVCNAEDVNRSDWYYGYVARSYKDGIVNGISKTHFGTGLNISRQDVAVMLERCINKYNYKLSPTITAVTVNDIDSVSEYARQSVEIMCSYGIINGDENGNFRPADSVNRAETAKLISELLKRIKEVKK